VSEEVKLGLLENVKSLGYIRKMTPKESGYQSLAECRLDHFSAYMIIPAFTGIIKNISKLIILVISWLTLSQQTCYR